MELSAGLEAEVRLKNYIEEGVVGIANYIIDNDATVRQTAKAFGVSKGIE